MWRKQHNHGRPNGTSRDEIYIFEMQNRLEDAAGIAKAENACAKAGNIREAIEIFAELLATCTAKVTG